MTVFLETYKEYTNSQSSENSKEKISFLEDKFSVAVYDFLETAKENNEYDILKSKTRCPTTPFRVWFARGLVFWMLKIHHTLKCVVLSRILTSKNNQLINLAEEVSKEFFLDKDEKKSVSILIKNIIKEDNLKFMRMIFPYLIRHKEIVKIYRRS